MYLVAPWYFTVKYAVGLAGNAEAPPDDNAEPLTKSWKSTVPPVAKSTSFAPILILVSIVPDICISSAAPSPSHTSPPTFNEEVVVIEPDAVIESHHNPAHGSDDEPNAEPPDVPGDNVFRLYV